MTTAARRTLIAAAVVIFVLGLALSAKISLMTWRAFELMDKSFVRILVPGVRIVSLPAPGTYTIFFEYKSELGGRTYSAAEDVLDGMEILVRDAETGEEIEVSASGAGGTYSLGSREGRALLSFSIDRPGRYRVAATLPDDEEGDRQYVLAIGKGLTKYVFLIIGMIFGLVVVFLITIAVPTALIAVAVTSQKSRASPN